MGLKSGFGEELFGHWHSEPTPYENGEYEVDYVRANGKDCLGCERHKKDMMLTIKAQPQPIPRNKRRPGIDRRPGINRPRDPDDGHFDFFMTDEQAKKLITELLSRCTQNGTYITKDLIKFIGNYATVEELKESIEQLRKAAFEKT